MEVAFAARERATLSRVHEIGGRPQAADHPAIIDAEVDFPKGTEAAQFGRETYTPID